MQHATLYFWRIQDSQGKWVTTRHRVAEADMLQTHPEAERIYGESLTIQVPESPEAFATRLHEEHLLYPAPCAVTSVYALGSC